MTVVRFVSATKELKIKISKNILPYFIVLKQNFTEFQLDMALRLKSKYSKRIYEMLSQCREIGQINVEVDELKYRFFIKNLKTGEDKYEGWGMFKKNVLDIPQKELAEKTDISFEYKLTKTGKRYTSIEFKVHYNPS